MYLYIEAKDIIFAGFICISAWYSYRAGRQQGIMEGIDNSIYYLRDEGFIKLEELPDGDIKIFKAGCEQDET